MISELTRFEKEYRLAQADASLAALLARGFLRPEMAFVETLRDGSYLAQLHALLNDAGDGRIADALANIETQGARLSALEAEDARLAMEVDYNRLFVGPGRLLAVPYESFYVSVPDEHGRGTICGAPMLAVKEFYDRFGTAMPENFVDYPDHIAFELEFLSLLAAEEAKCWQAANEEGARVFQEGAAEFRSCHFGTWVKRFAADVEAGAQEPFYPALAQLACITQF